MGSRSSTSASAVPSTSDDSLVLLSAGCPAGADTNSVVMEPAPGGDLTSEHLATNALVLDLSRVVSEVSDSPSAAVYFVATRAASISEPRKWAHRCGRGAAELRGDGGQDEI